MDNHKHTLKGGFLCFQPKKNRRWFSIKIRVKGKKIINKKRMEQQAFDAEAIKSESNVVSWTKKNDKQLIFHLIEEMKSQAREFGGCQG